MVKILRHIASAKRTVNFQSSGHEIEYELEEGEDLDVVARQMHNTANALAMAGFEDMDEKTREMARRLK